MPPRDRFVTLTGGLTIPAVALYLALDLEARGISLVTDADHQFLVPDDPRLTATRRRSSAGETISARSWNTRRRRLRDECQAERHPSGTPRDADPRDGRLRLHTGRRLPRIVRRDRG